MDQHFAVVTNIAGENAWFNICQKKQIPCILVKKRRKYADVHFDYITLDPTKDHIFRSEDYKNEIIKILSKYKIKPCTKGAVICVGKVPIEIALLLAEDIYQFIYKLVK